MKKSHLLYLLSLCSAAGISSLPAQNLVTNGDFEKGTAGWTIFAPPDAKECNPQLEAVAGGRDNSQAGQMSCSAPTRFAITNYLKKGTYGQGQRLRVSAWVKAGEDFEPQASTPGFVIRVTMFTDGEGPGGGMAPAQDGSFCIGLNGTAIRGNDIASLNDQGVPKEWTKVEGVFETSPDVTNMNVAVFIWKGSGKLLVDDVVIEPVDETVALSPTAN